MIIYQEQVQKWSEINQIIDPENYWEILNGGHTLLSSKRITQNR